MSNRESLDYTIDNTLGVEHVEVNLRHGVNVARGVNGSGKTSTIRAIVRAQGGKAELEPREGATRGKVVGPGVLVHIGKATRRTATDKGAASLSLAEVAPLSQLIDPGIKDTDSAARARLRALVDLLQVTVDDAAIEKLCQGDAKAMAWLRGELLEGVIDDLDVAEKKVKGHFEARARRHEAEEEEAEGRAQAASGRAAGLLEQLGGEANLVDESPERARESLQAGVREHERQKGRCEQREALERQQAEIRATLGERPDVATPAEQLEVAHFQFGEAVDRVQKLERQLTEARAQRDAANREVEWASENVERASEAARQWDERKAILERSVEGLTRDELDRLEVELVQTREERLERAVQSSEYRQAVSDLGTAEEAQRIARDAAQLLRGRAAALHARLGEILAQAGAEGLSIVDGRIHAMQDGKLVDWERLSQGQKTEIAARIAVQVYTPESVVPFGWELWAALDPENRRLLNERTRAAKLFLLTEEPDAGPLRVEPMESAA